MPQLCVRLVDNDRKVFHVMTMYKVEKTNDLITISFPSDLKFIDHLIRDVTTFLNDNDITIHGDIKTIIQTLCVNSVEHGNSVNPDATVLCSLASLGDGRFKIVVEDEGCGFDLSNIDMKLPPHDSITKKPRGISIVNALSDELKYERDGSRAIAFVTASEQGGTTSPTHEEFIAGFDESTESKKNKFPFTKRDDFLIYGSPDLRKEEIDEMTAVLRSGWIGTGPRVADFERSFGEYKDVTYSVALASCTAALHLSLLASDIQAGDEVITSAMTFCATINSIIHAGGTPVIVDIDPETIARSAL